MNPARPQLGGFLLLKDKLRTSVGIGGGAEVSHVTGSLGIGGGAEVSHVTGPAGMGGGWRGWAPSLPSFS